MKDSVQPTAMALAIANLAGEAGGEQRTPEWFAKRAGRFTGSVFIHLMKKRADGKGYLKGYGDLINTTAVQRLTGLVVPGPSGLAQRWGEDMEFYAREAYEVETGNVIKLVDFIVHPQFDYIGVSPDGLIGDDGGIEIKCPKDPEVHLERFYSGMPEEYKYQVHGAMMVTGRQWWHFVSYDPRFPEAMRLYIEPVQRDELVIEELLESIHAAEKLVQARVAEAAERAAQAAARLQQALAAYPPL